MLVTHSDQHQNEATYQSDDADDPMDHEARQHEKDGPRPIEHGKRGGANQRLAQRIEITRGLGAGSIGTGSSTVEAEIDHGGREQLVEAQAEPGSQTLACGIQQTQDQQRKAKHGEKKQQRDDAARCQHTVIDLEHEQRRGEIKQVDPGAEQNGPADQVTACRKRRAQTLPRRHEVSPLMPGDLAQPLFWYPQTPRRHNAAPQPRVTLQARFTASDWSRKGGSGTRFKSPRAE